MHLHATLDLSRAAHADVAPHLSAARVRAGWDTSVNGSDEYSDAVGSPSIYTVSSMLASSQGASQGGSQRHSGGSSRTTGR